MVYASQAWLIKMRRTRKRRFGPRDLPEMLSAGQPSSGKSPKVLLAGKLTAMTAPGGGETQMIALARALPGVGVRARLWRPWEDSLAEADCIHLLGSVPEHLEVVAAAHRCQVPVVVSPIAWFDLVSCWRQSGPWLSRTSAATRFLLRAALPRIPSWRRRLYHMADLLLPNSQAEAEQLIRYFGVDEKRLHVTPNGADERFAQASPQAFARRVGGRGFVLYPGRIEPRKNQLGFLRAMQGTDVPIVVLGNVVPGHQAYADACRRAAGENVKFIDGLAHDDPLLASAYAACGCLALTSWFETPGLVALEAALQGVPLVLTARGCAREYFGGWADYVEPDDLRAIRRKVLAAMNQPRSPALAHLVRSQFTWKAAAAVTRAAYEKVT
jgi:glycosyltransferase involved in cell wall biosynthesis